MNVTKCQYQADASKPTTGDEPQSGLSPPANDREFTVIKLLVSPLLILMTFSEQGNKFNSSGLNEQRR